MSTGVIKAVFLLFIKAVFLLFTTALFTAIDALLFYFALNSVYGCYVALFIWGYTTLSLLPVAFKAWSTTFLIMCKLAMAMAAWHLISHYSDRIFNAVVVAICLEFILYIIMCIIPYIRSLRDKGTQGNAPNGGQ